MHIVYNIQYMHCTMYSYMHNESSQIKVEGGLGIILYTYSHNKLYRTCSKQ